LTNSSIYLLAAVGLSQYDFNHTLINVHIKHSENPSLVVICKNVEGDLSFQSLLEKIKAYPTFIGMWTDDDDKELCIEMMIPKRYHAVYNKFLAGKWSEFPNNYKEKLISIYGRQVVLESKQLTVCSVLYPQDYKRKQIAEWLEIEDWKILKEVKSSPDTDYEMYRTVDQLKMLDQLKNNTEAEVNETV
jgi:hypothetical protein